VNATGQATSTMTLTRGPSVTPILAAGIGGALTANGADVPEVAPVAAPDDSDSTTNPVDDHSETAWRIRHARRSVLKDVTIPLELLTDDGDRSSGGGLAPVGFLGKAVESRAHL